ncbi:hypothetical protein [Coleofasciculus chthonoplastes]|uniref:hypothetical protein n=1 Tax=Coleofasciculus chthonoplastes TaxID=64178 RepID=UPI0032F51B4B
MIALSIPKHAIALPLFVLLYPFCCQVLRQPDELIPPQSISSGKSLIESPPCSNKACSRFIWEKVNLMRRPQP